MERPLPAAAGIHIDLLVLAHERTVRHRYYNPITGRYISRDPSGYSDGPNVYLYVHGNPINHIDPLGLGDDDAPMLGQLRSEWNDPNSGQPISTTTTDYLKGDAISAALGAALGAGAGAITPKPPSNPEVSPPVASDVLNTSPVDRAIAVAREGCGGDCEHASMIVQDQLGSDATIRPIGGNGILHSVVDFRGTVIDPTASQYVKPGAWTPESLNQAGLTDAVQSGKFTPEQHLRFMKEVQDAASKSKSGDQ